MKKSQDKKMTFSSMLDAISEKTVTKLINASSRIIKFQSHHTAHINVLLKVILDIFYEMT